MTYRILFKLPVEMLKLANFNLKFGDLSLESIFEKKSKKVVDKVSKS